MFMSTPANAWVNGKKFPLYSEGTEISRLSRSTIGISLSLGADKKNCSAIAIGNNKFLTAAHCFTHQPDPHIPEKDLISLTIIEASGRVVGEFTPNMLSFSKNTFIDNGILSTPNDFVIVTLNTGEYFTNPLSKNDMIKTRVEMNEFLETQGDMPILRTDTDLYGLGYKQIGSSFSFQYGNYNAKKGSNQPFMILNPSPSILLNYIVNAQSFVSEPGDSGSGVYACKPKGKAKNCKLIGLLSGRFAMGSKPAMETVPTYIIQ